MCPNKNPKVKVLRLHGDAKLPAYANSEAAGADLSTTNGATVMPGEAHTFGTGLKFEIPPGSAMLVYGRSGLGFKHGLRLVNCVGIIDSDYRGEVMVRLINDGDQPVVLAAGDRIAQAMVVPAPQTVFEEVDELSDTARGAGGFGSTGLKAIPVVSG